MRNEYDSPVAWLYLFQYALVLCVCTTRNTFCVVLFSSAPECLWDPNVTVFALQIVLFLEITTVIVFGEFGDTTVTAVSSPASGQRMVSESIQRSYLHSK